MAKTFTIGELAKEAGVPSSTVRYYERRGLLHPEGRTGGNYRVYSLKSLESLRFIRAAQATGFTLEDVTSLLELRPDEAEPCQEVRKLLEERLAEVEKRMLDLRRVKRVLRSSLELCKTAENSGRCGVMEQLTRQTKTRK